MEIRKERESDYFEVENLTREAFWNVYKPGCDEHYVLHNMRSSKEFVGELDYVIEENSKIIANIVYAKGSLERENGEREEILIFGPVSVLPDYQNKGYGGKLIKFTLQKVKETGFDLVAITGNPDYYHRFGFESASKYGIFYSGMDKSEEAPFFMVKILNGKTVRKGVYSDPVCYVADVEAVEEFDKKFPPKKKEVREGQIFN